jgi:hypothetical protein
VLPLASSWPVHVVFLALIIDPARSLVPGPNGRSQR